MDAKTPDTLIPLKNVPDLTWLPRTGGHKWHVSTIYDWAKNGRRGVRLRTVWAGGLCTTERWLMDFFSGKAAGEENGQSADRQMAIKRAERELDAAGIR